MKTVSLQLLQFLNTSISFPTLSLTLIASCSMASFSFADIYPTPEESPESWYEAGEQELQRAIKQRGNTRRAKNIILFVGDGMGLSTVTAARIFDGQKQGNSGEEHSLSFEKLPYAALSKTYNTNQQTPDSAGTMTAMMTGVKTKAGFISVNQNAIGGDCASAEGNHLTTLLEQAETIGMSTGVVSTAQLTHATPAATYSHVPARGWESDAQMPDQAKQMGCKDIAAQLIEFENGNGLEVAMGGGRNFFLPESEAADSDDDSDNGVRLDGRDLTKEWLEKYPNSAYINNKEGLQNLDLKNTDHVLGLFNPSHMQYDYDRQQAPEQEPSLTLMTETAIQLLQKNRKGFFLMVESGRIDHSHHAGVAHSALQDAREFSNAVQAALDMVDLKDTLVIVTADHSHVFTVAGYPTRGNSILGKVIGNQRNGEPNTEPALARDRLPYTTVGYQNGGGFVAARQTTESQDSEKPSEQNPLLTSGPGRKDISTTNTEAPDYHQEALIPTFGETHSAEDVAIYAGGPWAHLFQRTHEQNFIYHVMRHAARMKKKR